MRLSPRSLLSASGTRCFDPPLSAQNDCERTPLRVHLCSSPIIRLFLLKAGSISFSQVPSFVSFLTIGSVPSGKIKFWNEAGPALAAETGSIPSERNNNAQAYSIRVSYISSRSEGQRDGAKNLQKQVLGARPGSRSWACRARSPVGGRPSSPRCRTSGSGKWGARLLYLGCI